MEDMLSAMIDNFNTRIEVIKDQMGKLEIELDQIRAVVSEDIERVEAEREKMKDYGEFMKDSNAK